MGVKDLLRQWGVLRHPRFGEIVKHPVIDPETNEEGIVYRPAYPSRHSRSYLPPHPVYTPIDLELCPYGCNAGPFDRAEWFAHFFKYHSFTGGGPLNQAVEPDAEK